MQDTRPSREWSINLRWLQAHGESGLIWFRAFGRGLLIKDVRRHPPVYSQRNRPALQLGFWFVQPLPPPSSFASLYNAINGLFPARRTPCP